MRVVCLLLSCALCFAACTSSGIPISEGPGNSASPDAGTEIKTTTPVLTRIGEIPKTGTTAMAIQCANERICWLNTQKVLWQSVDGGKAWREIYQAPEEIVSYSFIDTEIGFSFSFDKLYRTADGGLTWTHQESPLENSNGQTHALWFLGDGKTGWLAGGIYRDQTADELQNGVPNNTRDVTGKRVLEEAIFRTNDGGKTWQQQRFVDGANLGRILQIQFVNAEQGLALGEQVVYQTRDSGATWNSIDFQKSCVRKEYLADEYDVSPDNVEMLDSKLMWISYRDGRVIKTVDGGQHWCDLIQPGAVSFEGTGRELFTAMHFANGNHGWGLGADRLLYETRDGKTWSRVNSELRFNGIDFIGPELGFLVSDNSIYNLRPS